MFPCRFEVYSTGTSSLQADSYTEMGELLFIYSANLLVVVIVVEVGLFHFLCRWFQRSCLLALSSFPLGLPPCLLPRMYAQDRTSSSICFFLSFLCLWLGSHFPCIRWLRLSTGMKLIAYHQPQEVIRLNTYRALRIKPATGHWRYAFTSSLTSHYLHPSCYFVN